MEKSDSDSLEGWDVVTVSQVLETGAAGKDQDKSTDTTTLVTDKKNDLKNSAESESLTDTSDVSVESENVPVAQLENETENVQEQCDEDEPRSESESQKEESKASSPEPESQILAETIDESKNCDMAADELEMDSKISVKIEKDKSESSEIEHTSETIQEETVQDVIFDTSNRESSPGEPGKCQEPGTYVQELLVEKIAAEQDLASIESSSSDIDIIDEAMDESTISASIISSPLSLSISSSIADAPSMSSRASSQFVDIKYYNLGQEDVPKQESIRKRADDQDEITKDPDYPRTSSSQKKSKKSPSRRKDSLPSATSGSPFSDWLGILVGFLQGMSLYDLCLVGTITLSVCLTVIFRQTNIFAIVGKDDTMSQMKDMIEELKHDNKMLKEQMIKELRDENAFSSFEHQIKELRKENSKLNHMLFDVAKVLEKQKNFHDKNEAEHLLAPFKKEINKLKEHINVLKVDNEELQQEMVRMRYSGSHPKEKEMPAKEETQFDIESLKKWNELITLLSKELGLLAESDVLKDKKSSRDFKPFWKNLINDFKSSFNNFRKANFSEIFSEYKEARKKVLSDFYFLVKDFFTPEENPSTTKDNSQWRSVGDFIEDLKGKWTNIKDRLYTSDLRKFFEKRSTKSENHREEHQTTTEPGNVGTTYSRQTKPGNAETEEDTKWMFERAANREQQRDIVNEKEANWFLKKNQHNSEDKENRHL